MLLALGPVTALLAASPAGAAQVAIGVDDRNSAAPQWSPAGDVAIAPGDSVVWNLSSGVQAHNVLAATDPANPYGAALSWPDRTAAGSTGERPGHRPGRKAGAVVILVDGELVLYVERGGRTLLTFTDHPDRLARAADALALAARDGALGRLAVEKADGETVFDSPLARALTEAGFRPTARGLRLRG